MPNEENMSNDQEDNYVIMPQNDLHQVEQIAREYEAEPAKGIAHGIQKDAIQNGVGARVAGREPITYEKWKFFFKLFKIGNKYALSFWDEGTIGLTGEILPSDDIERWSMEGRLTAEQNLSRFLTRFDSGGNIGPGSFGRGKLIFQAASKDYTIICDSLRYDDEEYIAFDRKIEGTRLLQPRTPFQGDRAKEFVIKKTQGVLEPLEKPGTRITILNVKDEIIESIKNSFNESNLEIMTDYSASFIKMIEETWWEILDKFNASIFVMYDDQIKKVELTDPLNSIILATDRQNNYRVYKKTNFSIAVGSESYKIKELKFVLSPTPVDEDLRDCWVQRKRMKIGRIPGVIPHHRISKKVCFFLIADNELEDLILKSENITHYAFNWRGKGLRQIKQTVKTHLEKFQEQLGIRVTDDSQRTQRDMLDAMNEINEVAEDLGLVTDFSTGSRSNDADISIESFQLPNENSKRVDQDQTIGPIRLKIKNNRGTMHQLKLLFTGKQREMEEKILFEKNFDLNSDESRVITVDPVIMSTDDFRYGSGILLFAKVLNRNSNSKICQVSRMIWFGIDEPEVGENPFIITSYQPDFPRSNSRRVEVAESISNIKFKISNRTGIDVKLNVDLLVRKSPTTSSDVITLFEMMTERDCIVSAMSEKEFVFENLNISNEVFGAVNDGPANSNERKCELFFSARIAENIPQLNLIKGKNIGKRKIIFYIGMDPPGSSIFNNTFDYSDPEDGKRSKYSGDRASGYEFRLNVGHPSYIFTADLGEEAKSDYIKEQMLRQAFAIAIEEKEYRGVAEEFKEELERVDITPAEAFLTIEEIIGNALIKMGG